MPYLYNSGRAVLQLSISHDRWHRNRTYFGTDIKTGPFVEAFGRDAGPDPAAESALPGVAVPRVDLAGAVSESGLLGPLVGTGDIVDVRE
jgi:hypothetical protein